MNIFNGIVTLATLLGMGCSTNRLEFNSIHNNSSESLTKTILYYNLKLEEEFLNNIKKQFYNFKSQSIINLYEAEQLFEAIETEIRRLIFNSTDHVLDFHQKLYLKNIYLFNKMLGSQYITSNNNLLFQNIISKKYDSFDKLNETLTHPILNINTIDLSNVNKENIITQTLNNKLQVVDFNRTLGLYPINFVNLKNNLDIECIQEPTSESMTLNNLGYTCFINALLQSINNIFCLKDTIISLKDIYAENTLSRALIDFLEHNSNENLTILCNQIWSIEHEIYDQNQDKIIIKKQFPKKNPGDAQELLMSFIEHLNHKDLVVPKELLTDEQLSDLKNLKRILGFQIEKNILHPETNEIISKIQPQEDQFIASIELPIYKINSLKVDNYEVFKDMYAALEQSYLKEEIDEYTTESKEKLINVSAISYFTSLPKVLIINLKRYLNDQRKIFDKIDFPFEFDIDPYLKSKELNIYTKYELTSIIMHHGSAVHYTTYIKKENLWYHCDDNKIGKPLTEEELKNLLNAEEKPYTTPYILFYKQKDLTNNSFENLESLKKSLGEAIEAQIENKDLKNKALKYLNKILTKLEKGKESDELNYSVIYNQVINSINKYIKTEIADLFQRVYSNFDECYVKNSNEGTLLFLHDALSNNPLLISIVKLKNIRFPFIMINKTDNTKLIDSKGLEAIKAIHKIFINPYEVKINQEYQKSKKSIRA